MKIVVHSGSFHADEITAIALLIAFKIVKKDIQIVRTRDEKILAEAKANGDFVLDVGGEYDGISNFDHHHDRNLPSSAGLIWKYIQEKQAINKEDYKDISELVKAVDEHDVGIKKAGKFEFSTLVSNFNGLPEKEDENFMEALAFVLVQIKALKRDAEALSKTKVIIEESSLMTEKILVLKEFARQWDFFLNKKEGTNLDYVVYEDKKQGNWKIQVVPTESGSFNFGAPALEKDDMMIFVHATGFLAVADTLETMKKYVEKYISPTP